MRRRRGGGRPNAKVETTPSSFDALQIVGCKDDVVGPIIRGSYTLQEKNHDRPVFRKDEKVGSKGTTDVLLYFWDDKESPDFSGWWFGPQIGGDEVWAFHPDTTAKSPPTSGWQCPFDGPIDSSIEIVPKLVKGAQAPGRQPGTARKEVVTVVRTAAEQEALRQKELELMRQHEQISIRLQEERERLVIQRQEELERRKIMEAERKEREHHVRLLLRRALEKLRLAKPATIKELTLEVDKLMVKEGDLLGRSLRVEAEKVKHEAKLRVSKIAQFLQRADMKKREAEESKRQQEEASKKLIEQVEQYVKNVEAMAESLEEKINSLEDTTEAPSDAELECWTEAVVQADKVVEEAFQTCMAFVKENTEAIAEVDYDGRPGKELLQPLIGRASTAQGKRLGASGMASIREVALQRRAVALEALERKGLAEALLEREKAIFKRYDSDGDDRMTIADALQYARSEFGFEACPSALERLFLNLADRWGKDCARSLPFERFHDLKVAVGIAREVARDQERQSSKQERQAILSYAIGETEAVIDKAEAACHEAKEDADRLSELQGTGLSSSEMSEACQKVAARVAQAEEELDLAKRQAEELGRGDASGLLEDHRTESARLLSRFMKPKQQLTSAKFVLGHWSKQVSARRAVEVQNFGLKVRAALRAASPKAQGTGTELLEGLGDSEGDPLDKDDVAGFVRLRMGEDAPEDLVTSWLDSVTEKQEYKEILTREDLWLLIRICYKVVKPTELTTDSAMDSTSLATLDIGEVVELIGEEVSAAEAEDLHRIRARRLKDGQEGWVTVKGSGGVVVLQPGGDRLCVLKETSLTESLSISGQDAFRLLRVGEILEITGVESIDETSGLLRARVRAMSDGRIGWATKISSSGSVFLRQL